MEIVLNTKPKTTLHLDRQQIQRYFSTQPVLRAWLFGSYADGTATEESDVDILVELDHTQPIGLHYIQMIWDLESMVHKKVDLVTQKGLSPYVRANVEKQKILMYEK